ncbi:MAG: ABC transporter permease [Solirubrobacteraceae bacterium]
MPPSAMSPARQRVIQVLAEPAAGITIFLIIVSAVMTTQNSTFLTVSNWFNIISQIVVIMVLAIGMTLVMIGGGIDLSVGAILGLTGGVVAWLLNHNVPLGAAFLGALAAGLLLGLVNGIVITKLRIPPFVATLAMLGAASGILFVWTNGIPFLITESNAYRTIAGLDIVVWQITVPMVVVAVLALGAGGLLRYTRFGRHLRATGSNEETARLSGVNVQGVKIKMYALSGLLAAVGAILLVGRLSTVEPTTGADYEITVIAAAVMGGAALTGGRGSVLGALLGAITLSVIQNVINLVNINTAWDTLITGAIILLAVMFDRFVSSLATRQIAGPAPPAKELAAA